MFDPSIVPEIAQGPVAGQNCRAVVPMAVYVPVSDPLEDCARLIEMFVIPAAGPGENQTPDMSLFAGVVSDGPHEPSASAPSASNNKLRKIREIEFIER